MVNPLNRDAWAEVNLSAIKYNIGSIRRRVQPSIKLCVVVKANAYGHGAIAISRCALEEGADMLAVATVDEGLELRAAGFTVPILILGVIPSGACGAAIDAGLTMTVSDLTLAKKISDAAVERARIAKVHLKLETGMGRIGVSIENAADTAEGITRLPKLELEGLFSHFASADTIDKSFTREQIALFKRAIDAIEGRGISIPIKHIAESAAILELPEAHFDMVRSGIITYGLYPSDEVEHTIELRPAMALKARVAFVKRIPRGMSIGYGREFIADRESVIATLPIGYADGYIRAFKGFAVELKGKRVPITGRVCMDQVMIDVTDLDGVSTGDEVTLWGSPSLSIDDAAHHLNTINYEITCLVSSRVPIKYTIDG